MELEGRTLWVAFMGVGKRGGGPAWQEKLRGMNL